MSKTDVLCVLDNVFLVLSGIYMAFMVYTMSMFQWEVPVIAKIVLLGLMLIVAGLRVLLIGLKNLKVWIGVAICAVYGGVFYVSDNSNFLFLAACTIGYLEIDYRKILRTYLIAVGTALAIVVIAAMTGIIENRVTSIYKQMNKKVYKRQAMGTIYPTDFASLVFFLLLYLWVALKRAPDWATLLLPFISFAIAWRVTYSWTSMICSMLFFAIILYHMFDQWFLLKHPRLQGINDWIVTLLVVVLAGAMTYLMLQYGSESEAIQRLDKFQSNRLFYAKRGLENYGIHPFGSYFEMVGLGATKNSQQVTGQAYNFIDCSYLLILIRYGYILLFSILTIWTVTLRRVQIAGDRRLALTMALIAIHSVAEHHMIDIHYNIAVAMPLAMYGITKLGEQDLDKKSVLHQ